ncbi:unnamed protein product [Phytophthora fragariaefolia]|uniref:Unnamed protein product n=1 Tax=Phytophthora fragariaefolia TaxID=1490495 RepID=A0A9W6XMY8_9STRA|nr:unnamed protein product [Phytophthora fragariaefolia]
MPPSKDVSEEGVSTNYLRSSDVPLEADQTDMNSFIFQTDDLAGVEDSKESEEYPSTRHRKSEVPNTTRNSILMLTSSGAIWRESSQEPRPSVAHAVVTEVATFFDVFGLLGIPMIIVFLLSAAWTFLLAVIQVNANEMANTIMNTTEFDNGNFWLLPRPESTLVYSSVVLLSLFGAGYTGLVVAMICCYRGGKTNKPTKTEYPRSVLSAPTQTPPSPSSETGRESVLQRFLAWIHDIPVEIRQHYYVRTLVNSEQLSHA